MPEVVVLRGGLTVSLPALRLLWKFEERGLDVYVDAPTRRLRVGPLQLLSAVDKQQILVYRDELVELVRYCEAIQ